MGHILLVGAGFTHNWRGLLASEVMNHLHGRIKGDQPLDDILHRTGNFEEALSQLQLEYVSQQTSATRARLDHLQSAILEVFGNMDQALADRGHMEFSNAAQYSTQLFLSRFDAIFTLNQDLLLELHYRNETRGSPPRWSGEQFPGMQLPPNFRNSTPAEQLKAIWYPLPR